ncbi:MAG: acyltransferase family protein [Alphaproteobacteria bacterium]|nr:acyltransferase family protein [Alphaproteobacteria bacterium]
MSQPPPPVPYEIPSGVEMAQVRALLATLRKLHAPVFLDIDRVPDAGPMLFVGNHSLYAMLDAPQFFMELLDRKGIFVRGLGHHVHFRVPIWGPLLTRWGVVDGTRENCARLMEAGESVMVFPGGGREAAKRKGEEYQLIWKERLGFVKMAIAHGCPIVPWAALGADEAWTIVMDRDDLLASEHAGLIEAVYGALNVPLDQVLPLAHGLGPTLWPRPVRLYFSVAEPIPTAHLQGRQDDDAVCWQVRRQVEAAINGELDRLRALRDEDPMRSFRSRLLKAASRRLARLESSSGPSRA